MRPSFINEHQVIGLKDVLKLLPNRSADYDVGPRPLVGSERLFFRV
jgi:hypothetical protein